MADKKQFELAKQDYQAGMTYPAIAQKYGVAVNTVRSWKYRHGWAHAEHVLEQQPQATTKKIVADVADNGTLNDKQKLFCLHYLQSFNATKAYQQAYNVGYKTAMASGSRLLTNPKITAELKRLKQIRQEAEALTAEDVLHELKRQAFADLGDYIEFATREEATTTKRDANAVTKHSYVYLKDQADVDTSLLKSIKVGKDSVVVELADKQRALFELLKHLEPTATASAQPQPIIVDDIHAEQMGVNDDEETE